MKVELKKLKVKFQGQELIIDLQKELSINENLINSQLSNSPTNYYIFCALRDKYIKERDTLQREKEVAYSQAWLFYKESNERWSNDYVSNKAITNKKYQSICERFLKAQQKAQEFITICRAYESREGILRTLNASLRKTM